jgi:hypothetical protein
MKLPRRNFLHLAAGAAALPAMPRTARHPLALSAKRKPTMPGATAGAAMRACRRRDTVLAQQQSQARFTSSRAGRRPVPRHRQPMTKKGRCRLHGGAKGSGGPTGERNGQYRHGERTEAAIAEQRKFSALLKLLRAGLT